MFCKFLWNQYNTDKGNFGRTVMIRPENQQRTGGQLSCIWICCGLKQCYVLSWWWLRSRLSPVQHITRHLTFYLIKQLTRLIGVIKLAFRWKFSKEYWKVQIKYSVWRRERKLKKKLEFTVNKPIIELIHNVNTDS